jgi:erythronate-4-phosphate dehydrogenase
MNKKKIHVLADENINGLEYFEKIADVSKIPGRAISAEHLKNTDALLIRSVSKINKSLLENSSVRFIGSATSGIDHVDIDYLQKNDIRFDYAPGSNANSVVQYVFASLAFLSEKYGFDWRDLSFSIVGAGNVGGLLACYLDKLEINFSIYDPFLSEAHPYSDNFVSFAEVLQQDVISVHTPLTTEGAFPTQHLFNRQVIHNLSKNAILINTARGAVFDNKALHEEYARYAWKCVLDVWENEPDIFVPLLKDVDLGTSHIAGYSYEGKEQGSAKIYQAFVDFFGFKDVPGYPLNNDNKLLDVPAGKSELEQINQAILAAYPIGRDYLQMIELANNNPAVSFDALRKYYPLRREFQHYCLDYSTYTASAEKVLRILGFN